MKKHAAFAGATLRLKEQASLPRYEVVPRTRGMFVLTEAALHRVGEERPGYPGEYDRIVAYGSREAVLAAARLIAREDYRVVTCVDGAGGTDSHMAYARGHGRPGGSVCAFCGEP